MMTFFVRAGVQPRSLGVFPGSYNPPTRAHLALAEAALAFVDEVVFVIPRAFPHKAFEGASFEQRVEMLRAVAGTNPGFSAAATEGGLFLEIARECREEYDSAPRLYFLCGRDAAERIVNWDYGHPDVVPKMLDEFELLVAARYGAYTPPPGIESKVHLLGLDRDYSEVSATEVRERIREGRPWRHLVPDVIAGDVLRVYS
jgi:nicotinate (nicotinamide) nucleotide adenylyltransferase